MSRQVSLSGEPVEAPIRRNETPAKAGSERAAILDAAPPDTSWSRVARWIVRARAESMGKEKG